jgi:hypothetical protein
MPDERVQAFISCVFTVAALEKTHAVNPWQGRISLKNFDVPSMFASTGEAVHVRKLQRILQDKTRIAESFFELLNERRFIKRTNNGSSRMHLI